ncbi:hypothetical protein VPH35_114858 [Triticum aestivum]
MPAAAAPEQLQCSQPPDAAVCAKGRRPRLLPQHADSSGSGWIRMPAPRSDLPASLGSSATSTTSYRLRDPTPPLAGHFLAWRRRPHIGTFQHEQQQRTPR